LINFEPFWNYYDNITTEVNIKFELRMNHKKRTDLLLPWYLNDTLSPEETLAVDEHIHHDTALPSILQEYQSLRNAIINQPLISPSFQIRTNLIEKIRAEANRPRSGRLAWSTTVLLAIAVFFLLWSILQPGILLEWTASGGDLSAFRVYRAPQGTTDFELVREISVQSQTNKYRFLDSLLFPGEKYIYIIEGINTSGEATIWETGQGNSLGTLPIQGAIVITSLLMAYSLIILLQNIRNKMSISYLLSV
jgi:hypothetical protein